jgi:protein-S-isoprenylcysteine O-methyltransferase Ste14
LWVVGDNHAPAIPKGVRGPVDPIAQVVLFGVGLCWLVFAAAFIFRKRLPKGRETKQDRRSLMGILLQVCGYALIGFHPASEPFMRALVPAPAEVALGILTLALAAASVSMVIWAVRTLGKQWALAARLVEGHRLITKGPYRFVRNPIYAGMFGMLVASGLALQHWGLLLPAIVLFVVGTLIRVRTEEELLRGAFGEQFEAYARRVPALFPGIY